MVSAGESVEPRRLFIDSPRTTIPKANHLFNIWTRALPESQHRNRVHNIVHSGTADHFNHSATVRQPRIHTTRRLEPHAAWEGRESWWNEHTKSVVDTHSSSDAKQIHEEHQYGRY